MNQSPLEHAIEILNRELSMGGPPSESAIYRAIQQLEVHKDNFGKSSLSPGTESFDDYVRQKVNSDKDVKNIAAKHGLPEEFVKRVAHGEGRIIFDTLYEQFEFIPYERTSLD